jgi:hypothetical protein
MIYKTKQRMNSELCSIIFTSFTLYSIYVIYIFLMIYPYTTKRKEKQNNKEKIINLNVKRNKTKQIKRKKKYYNRTIVIDGNASIT